MPQCAPEDGQGERVECYHVLGVLRERIVGNIERALRPADTNFRFASFFLAPASALPIAAAIRRGNRSVVPSESPPRPTG